MSNMRIERVLALPGTLSPSTMYIVKAADAGLAEVYFTDSAGTEARHVINKTEINTMITTAVSNFSNILLVADVAARNALVLDHNALVLVTDATADATVLSGAALYFYDTATTTFTKVSEFESLDVTLTWAAIQGKPTSVVADIDDAVTKRHVHANKAIIDKVGENADGITFDGANVQAYIANAAW